MSKQMIISINREFGAGGHEIAEKIAEDMGLNLYDSNILSEIAAEKNVNAENYEKYDEKPKNVFLSRRVKEHSNSTEQIIAEAQFDYMRRKADSGESFVIVGRCSDAVLKDYEGLVTIFVTGRYEKKVAHVMEKYSVDRTTAKDMILKNERRRRWYHNSHAETKWGDSRYYDICIDATRVGIDAAAELLEDYINHIVD